MYCFSHSAHVNGQRFQGKGCGEGDDEDKAVSALMKGKL